MSAQARQPEEWRDPQPIIEEMVRRIAEGGTSGGDVGWRAHCFRHMGSLMSSQRVPVDGIDFGALALYSLGEVR
ncbi:MAG: hypothetical protein HYZ89_01465 [Candidatus Omnitrophica bacterium]|nr:hypothetical protein [Candidatus Omnitrophota bacterium]